ncbi:MAG: molybdopterin-guanine dinucleotide biosynthesis protein B [Candidatus Bathyarchaeia archaeon]
MIIIAVVGSKKSGKTKTVEALVGGLTKRGYSVATAKHVSEQDFTIDTKGKDTWLHAQAGAKTIMLVAPRELTTIRKGDTGNLTLREIVQNCRDDTDMLILEGFRNLVEQEPTVPKIVAVKTKQEIADASTRFNPILAFTGPMASPPKPGKPVVDVLAEPEKIVAIVEKHLGRVK